MRLVVPLPRLLAVLVLWAAPQGLAAAEPSPDQLEFFETKVRPLLVAHCYSCHSAGAEKLKGGFLLDTRAGLLKGGTSGSPAIIPGDPDRSPLIRAVRGNDPDLQMPPKEKLTAQQIADLVAWVHMGAPDPRVGQSQPLAPAVDANTFWSFQPPRDPPVPQVKDAVWARNDVDRFVLAKLEEKGLKPSPEADRRTLIRRATFDLTGLPPTAEEVDAFLADASPDAYDRMVERLLASPRYGERWGRYWLDLARYSDTKGYVYGNREERRFIHSHAYRDWVIAAFNRDQPYDRFLMEQIAADQLGYPDTAARQAALPAMGFMTVGRRFLGVVPDIIDDRIDVVTRTTQGLTVACARCHDHKFDPIPTADYYSLYGVLEGSTERSVPVDLEPPRTPEYEAYLAGLNERVKKLQDTFAAKRDALEGRLRAQTREYLVAVLDADKLPPDVFYEIRDPNDVIPTVVRQWQRHLLRTSQGVDPVFAPWHALAALPADEQFAGRAVTVLETLSADASKPVNPLVLSALKGGEISSMKDVALAYGGLFVGAEEAWKELLAKAPDAKGLPDANLEALRQVLYGAGTPARIPHGSIVDVEWFFDEPTRVELGTLQKEIDSWHLSAPGAPAQAVVLEDKPEQRMPRVFKRGNPSTPGEEVPRQYLQVVAGGRREPFKNGSGRLELARAIASRDNPLTARVMVNRIWLHHFGAGLVDTPSDFGVRSDPPSHPELLDWLATRFVEQGWYVKQMHRLMMRSATYRQASADANSGAAAIDPQNRLLWRMNRARLDFESLRDALLAVSGELDLTAGGRPADVDGTRRSVYLLVDRQFLPGVFRVFDFANPDLHIPQRGSTTIPQQALFFMNGRFVTERAKALARREEIAAAPDDAERVRRLYRMVYQRPASEGQVSAALEFVRGAEAPAAAEPPPAPVATAWQYGYGEYDSSADRIKGFAPLPHFTGDAWQGGPAWPDANLGWVQLTATGGHAGNDLAHATVRRWVAPRDMTIRIEGTVMHQEAPGDGVAARIVSSRHGTLGRWQIHNTAAEAKVDRLEVRQGDTIDFIVDLLGGLDSDMFTWAPALFATGTAPPDGSPAQWVAKAEFTGPTPTPAEPLSPWAMYAQVLLLSNEFMFVD
jgi:mono/diheme cytochrome c family protein